MRGSTSCLALLILAGCAEDPMSCVEGPSVFADLTAVSATTDQEIEGLEICSTHPPGCPCEVTGDRGRAVLEVPADSDVGFVTVHEDYVRLGIQLTTGSEDFGGAFPIITNPEATVVLAVIGQRLRPGEGLLIVAPDRASPDEVGGVSYRMVHIESDTEYAPVYLGENGLPSMGSVTGPDGRGLFHSLPVGRYRFYSELLARCAVITGWTSGGGLEAEEPWVEVEVASETALALVLTGCHAP